MVSIRGGVEDTKLEAKDTKKIRDQGQGQPFWGQNFSRQRTGIRGGVLEDVLGPRTHFEVLGLGLEGQVLGLFFFGEHLRLCPWSLALASSIPVLGLESVCPRKGCPWPWPRIFFVSLALVLASSLVSSTPPLTGMLEAKDQGHRHKRSSKKKVLKNIFRRSPIHWRTQNFWLGEA